MKKLLSILMLLVAIVTGAKADPVQIFDLTGSSTTIANKKTASIGGAYVGRDGSTLTPSADYGIPTGGGKTAAVFVVNATATITIVLDNQQTSAKSGTINLASVTDDYYTACTNGTLGSMPSSAAQECAVSWVKNEAKGEKEYSFSSSVTAGKYIVYWTSGINGSIYLKRIEINAASSKTATTTTITGKSALNLDLKNGTSAGTLAATVVDAESKAVEGATVSWSSSDESVATINASTGAVTLKATGTTTLKATYAGNDDYAESEDSYEITVTDTRTASDLSVASEASVKIGKTETVAYTTSSTGAVSVESSNNSVATAVVDQVNKNITISGVAAGVATITVSQLADDDYAAGSKEISVTVIDPIAGTVIYNWNTVGTTTIVSTATTTNVSIKGTSTSAISFPNGLTKPAYAKIEVEGGFKKGDIITWTGCISNSNSSKVGAIMIANGYDDQAEGFKAYLDCSEMFNNVNDGQTAASSDSFVLNEDATELYIGRTIGLDNATNTYVTQLTVTRPSTETVTIGKGGFSTFAGEYNYTVSGAKALAAQNKNTSVGFTEIPSETVIPANTGVVLQGTEGDEVTITYTNAAAGTVTTDMVGVTEANPFVASSNVYVIATKTAGTKFYKYTGSTFPVGKAYLNAAANAGDALDIVFDGATAVEAIAEANANSATPVKVIKNGKLFIGNYNVAGQLVK